MHENEGEIMKLQDIVTKLNLQNINKKSIKEDVNITHGYACDLLSQVLASAEPSSIWFTIQSHLNVIGVAVVAGIPAVVICEGHEVPDNVIEKADEENISLLISQENAFTLSGKLYECGIR